MSDDQERTRFYPQKLDARTSRMIGGFLFDPGRRPRGMSDEDWEDRLMQISRELEASTIISGPNTLQALSYYGVLRDGFDSKAARIVSDNLKRSLKAKGGKAREEATYIMRGGIPKEIEVRTGQV